MSFALHQARVAFTTALRSGDEALAQTVVAEARGGDRASDHLPEALPRPATLGIKTIRSTNQCSYQTHNETHGTQRNACRRNISALARRINESALPLSIYSTQAAATKGARCSPTPTPTRRLQCLS